MQERTKSCFKVSLLSVLISLIENELFCFFFFLFLNAPGVNFIFLLYVLPFGPFKNTTLFKKSHLVEQLSQNKMKLYLRFILLFSWKDFVLFLLFFAELLSLTFLFVFYSICKYLNCWQDLCISSPLNYFVHLSCFLSTV